MYKEGKKRVYIRGHIQGAYIQMSMRGCHLMERYHLMGTYLRKGVAGS